MATSADEHAGALGPEAPNEALVRVLEECDTALSDQHGLTVKEIAQWLEARGVRVGVPPPGAGPAPSIGPIAGWLPCCSGPLIVGGARLHYEGCTGAARAAGEGTPEQSHFAPDSVAADVPSNRAERAAVIRLLASMRGQEAPPEQIIEIDEDGNVHPPGARSDIKRDPEGTYD